MISIVTVRNIPPLNCTESVKIGIHESLVDDSTDVLLSLKFGKNKRGIM